MATVLATPATMRLDEAQAALVALLRRLEGLGYRFTTITSGSHGRVVDRRPGALARDLRDLLGWSLPAPPGSLDEEVIALLDRAGMLRTEDGLLKSAVRVSSVDGRLFLHSAWPTREKDSVFLGPDSYRFVRFLGQAFPRTPPRRIIDIGAGAGVGAISAAALAPRARIQMTEINPAAARLAAVNAAAAGVEAECVEAPGVEGVARGFDLAIANPPFMAGSSGRTYSAGGGRCGEQISLDWARAALERMAPGGRLIMYTASAIAEGGEDRLRTALDGIARDRQATLDYDEIDPDIFGQVLSMESYRRVERIAAVGVVLRRPG